MAFTINPQFFRTIHLALTYHQVININETGASENIPKIGNYEQLMNGLV